VASDADELGRTATAAVGSAGAPAESPGATLGRYRLERELGAGGMGVVHAAFDPDLERRVALKVLRVSAPTTEAKDRLMREARAMARLSHPNVVTVHEVGTAHGRDFVAMELIHGDNLAEWLRAAKRPAAQVIDAFVAAGRGLAAAHAAGIVHRDFKPHNVLRSRDGRIVVTDFGLAREAEGQLPVALDTTLPVRATAATTPGSLSGLTVTGALLGTPAYMAPEQWSHGAVTPATDQFAYCVALWEALTGARPYPGPSLDDLRAQVARGPGALDASKIPRRLRAILRRGLDPDPARRWPSMDALLGQLVRAERRPGVAFTIIAFALTAAFLLYLSRAPATAAPTCAPPARDLAGVWSPKLTAELIASGHADHARVLGAAVADWQVTRAGVCHGPAQLQPAQLACLDGVLARLDAVRQGLTRRSEPSAEDVIGQLVDPALCKRPLGELPRLALAPSPDVVAALELYGRAASPEPPADAEIMGLLAKPGVEPCAHLLAALALDTGSTDRARARRVMTDAVNQVDQCEDDRVRADLLIAGAPYAWELPIIGPKGQAAMRRAQTAAARVMQPDVHASLARLKISVARFSVAVDDALRYADEAIAGFGARGMKLAQADVAIHRNYLRLARATPADLAAITADVAIYRPIVVASRHVRAVDQLDGQAAMALFRRGDTAAAQAALTALWQRTPHPPSGPLVRGEVVDEAGRPVAGATVASGSAVQGNPVSAIQPMPGADSNLQITTTDARGRFTIARGGDSLPVIAEHGALRSDPMLLADRVRVVLRPTRTVRGRVELGGEPASRFTVTCVPTADPTGRYRLDAPVAADGTFVVEGASLGALRIAASRAAFNIDSERVEYQRIPASRAPVTGLVLALATSDRVIDVVVRSRGVGALDGAQLLLVPGRPRVASVNDLLRIHSSSIQVGFARPLVGESAPQAVIDKIRPGDLFSHLERAAPGELTACAIAFSGDLLDPASRKQLEANVNRLAVRCEVVGATQAAVVIELPPQARID
jgi:predicted Ser/Thr protein kinase